jgi:hypothetical protein
MFAVIAAVIFGLALILDWADARVSDAFTPQTLMMAGLLCVAGSSPFHLVRGPRSVPRRRSSPRRPVGAVARVRG